MADLIRLVRIQRTGSPVFQWDGPLDRGHDFQTGDVRALTEETATQLLREDGWALAPDVDPTPSPEE